MRILRVLPATLVSTIAVSYAAQAATQWWCDAGYSQPGPTVPVYLSLDVKNHTHHSDNTAWTDDELKREVQWVIERLNDGGASNAPPLYFADFEASGPWDACAPTGAITIRWNGDTNNCKSAYMFPPTPSCGALIIMGDSARCSVRWNHWAFESSDQTTKTWGGILMHEMAHGMGLDHWDAGCQPNTPVPGCTDSVGSSSQICGLMQQHGLSSEYYETEWSDFHAFNVKYGAWGFDDKLKRQSADAVTWTTLGGTFNMRVFGAAAWPGASSNEYMPVITVDSSYRPHMWLWYRPTDTMFDWGLVEASDQTGPIAVAAGSSGGTYYRYGFFVSGQSETITSKVIKHSYHPSSSSRTIVTANQSALRQGHTGTYDPRSERLIHVWRGEQNEILLAHATHSTAPGAGSTPVALTGDAYLAAYTPSIACGDAQMTYNCILVWASSAKGTGEHYHAMKWTQFRMLFSGGSWVFDFPNPVYNSGYVMFGPPSVVYSGPATGSDAFVVAFKNPGRCYYTLRKSQAPTAAFTDEVSHCQTTGRYTTPPIVGTAATYVEAWANFNVQ